MPIGNFAAGRTVVVTGGTAGVGRATALRFARSGARIGLIARHPAALRQVCEEIQGLGVRSHAVSADVADAAAVFEAADRIARELGPIDIWINDAMVTVFSPVAEIAPEEFHRVTQVTYLGCVHGTMAALRHMRPRNKGTIVQVGSALAYRGIPLQAAYCGAKHAIRGFTDSLRAELIHEGSAIGLTMVQLPAVNTPQFDWARTHMRHLPRPVAPVFQPEAMADAIFRATGRRVREHWIGLSTLKVILGSMVAPSFLDRYLARNAIAGQETDISVPADRRENLDDPVEDLHRVHGSFGKEAKSKVFSASGRTLRIAGGAMAAVTVILVVAAGIVLF